MSPPSDYNIGEGRRWGVELGLGRVKYGPHKNNFVDGPYRYAIAMPADPQPWIIYNAMGGTMAYVGTERWAKELVDDWNLKHAEWIMLKE